MDAFSCHSRSPQSLRSWTMAISTLDYLTYSTWEGLKSLTTSKKTYYALASYAEMMLLGTWFLWGSDKDKNPDNQDNPKMREI